MVGELVKLQTADKFVLNAFWIAGLAGKPVVVHVHGYGGNFYANQFVHTIGDMVSALGYGYLSVETRGSYDQQGLEVYGKGFSNTGAYLERLEDAYLDIDAAIGFLLKKGFDQIVLQGHSLGTAKVVRYLYEGAHRELVKKLVLLCPFERFALANMLTLGHLPEYKEIAKTKVNEGLANDLIPVEWLLLPMSYGTFCSWYQDSEANHCFDYAQPNYDCSYLKAIKQPVCIIVGSKDEFFSPHQPDRPQDSLNQLQKQFSNCVTWLIESARHSFREHEEVVAEKIKNFLVLD
jgi:pimeloyl-ACP methyl ester carboxylesterase